MRSNNEIRSNRAGEALRFYVLNFLREAYRPESRDENMVNLLTDLMHFAAAHSIEFETLIRMAKCNFDAEKLETPANCATCNLLGGDCNPDEEDYRKPCSAYQPACPTCHGALDLQRTEVIHGVSREVYLCVHCDLPYLRDINDQDGAITYAVPCVLCHNLWPRSDAHLIHDDGCGYGHFVCEHCLNEPVPHSD